MKLGKLARAHDPRVPLLSKRAKLVLPKPSVDWTGRVSLWPMLGNDEVGDCTAAAVYHLIQCWQANAWHSTWQPNTNQAIALYSAITGYDPEKPETDRGALALDVLNHWASLGVPAQGERDVIAFASIDPLNVAELKLSCQWFGGVYLGLQLPEAALGDGDWNYGPGLTIAGGHAVCGVAYDQDGMQLVTWGGLKRASWKFLISYLDEAYACVSRAWLDTSGTSPPGLSWDQLQADMASLGA